MTRGETISVAMPLEIRVLIYPSATSPGSWVSHISAVAKDVLDGELAVFGSVREHAAEPTRVEIADHVADWLRHEVMEQLGLDPHDGNGP